MREKVIKEKEVWKNLYDNYDNLADQILVDVLGYYTKEQRQDKIDAAIEFLNQIENPIDGVTLKNSIKYDLDSFERINNEAQIAYRTLQWVENEME